MPRIQGACDRGQDAERNGAGHASIQSRDGKLGAALALRRRHPLQEIAARQEEANQRAYDRIAHQRGLMGKEYNQKRALRRGKRNILTERAQVAA